MEINTIFNALFNITDLKSLASLGSTGQDDITPLTPDALLELLPSAFLIRLCGKKHGEYGRASEIFERAVSIRETAEQAEFLLSGLDKIRQEFSSGIESDEKLKARTEGLYNFITEYTDRPAQDKDESYEEKERDAYWSLFFPEAEGIYSNREERKRDLKRIRTVSITGENPRPVKDPGKELIFTSNIILTLPDEHTDYDSLNLSGDLIERLKKASEEEQLFFYDHPIQIGTKPENNEILYGLKGLNNTCAWEKEHGNMGKSDKLTVILSVSVTHRGLQHIAKDYIQYEIENYGSFENLEIYIFTEEDTVSMVDNILIPVLSGSGKRQDGAEKLLKKVFGVDGEYGRHYSFLKAIAAFWQVFIDPEKRGTFKIDLDQVFPEKELKEQTGKSAFEHFKNPLWGGIGTDAFGNEVELGMIAGALVNERDISKGIYTPDVTFDEKPSPAPEARIFYSRLMMGFSTEAELMTRYTPDGIDGSSRCIQRIHVTGGTNGILTGFLRKHRPFTPSFIGRAEDQSYILSVLMNRGTKLAYLHEDGLIMRHDKEAFAADAIKAASHESTIGDYIRILYFSKYAEVLTGGDIDGIKKIIDPFTGCFV